MYYKVRHYQYKNRIGNLKSEAVGVVALLYVSLDDAVHVDFLFGYILIEV